MRRKTAVVMLEAIFVLWGAANFIAGAILQPRFIQVAWTRFAAGSRWERLNQLGRFVEPGMTADDVRSILGEPTRVDDDGDRLVWVYWDGSRCAGDELTVTFARWWMQRDPPFVSEVCQGSEARRVGPPTRAYCAKYYHIVSPTVASASRP